MMSMKEGIEIKKWLELFAKVYNEQGGWEIGGERYKVIPLVYDTGFQPGQARAAIERLVYEDNVKYLVNSWGDPTDEEITITEPNKVLTVGGGIMDTSVDPKLQYYFRGFGIYFARALQYVIYQDYYNRIIAKGKTEPTGILLMPDSQFGRFSAMSYGATMKLAGFKVIDPIFYPGDITDYSLVATKVLALNPDMIDLGITSGDAIPNVLVALKDAGYKGEITPGNLTPFTLNDCNTRVGKEFMEGCLQSYFDPRGLQKDPEMLKLMDRYVQEYGEFQSEGAFWMGQWFIFRDAVNATQSVDVEVLKKYLENKPPAAMTLVGYSQLFARPDVKNYRTIDSAPGHGVGIIKDGVMQYYKQVTVRDQYLVSIMAYGLEGVYKKYWDEYGFPTFPAAEKPFFEYTYTPPAK
jgi:branched-chain amino acid transport system substrate-binding protein